MKRLFALLFLLVLIGGCAKVSEVSNEPSVANKTTAEAPKADPDNTIESLGSDLYKAKFNEQVTLQGRKILVTDIDQSTALFRAKIDDREVVFHGTKEVEIVSGLEMYVDSIESIGPAKADKSVIFHVVKFKLGNNEYLVRNLETMIVNDQKVSVGTSKIDSNLIRSIPVSVGDETDVKINEGTSYSFKTVDVTNIKTFVFDKSYALLKIVPKAAPEAPKPSSSSYY